MGGRPCAAAAPSALFAGQQRPPATNARSSGPSDREWGASGAQAHWAGDTRWRYTLAQWAGELRVGLEVAGKGAGSEHAGCHESSVEGREDREEARCTHRETPPRLEAIAVPVVTPRR